MAEQVIKPITPAEAAAAKGQYMPAAVFEAFNAEIAIRFAIGRAIVPQEAIVSRLEGAGFKRREIFDASWLNVESAYEAAGWKVSYTKPGYNESGDAYFEFSL